MYNSTIKPKKKICGTCKEEAHIFSKGDCKKCASKRYARKAQGTKAEPTRAVKSNKPIPKVSQNQLKKLAKYRPLRDKYMKENPICQFQGCNALANDLHHKKPRKSYLCDVSIFMAVCRNHHNWIHDNHKKAVQLGYLIQIV